MANHNVITGRQLIKKMPAVVPVLPKLIKGIMIANSRNKEKNVGLGICFERAVARNPSGLALKYQDVEISYSQLNDWVNKIAHYFMSIGIQKSDCVGIMIENRPELLATVLACSKIGAVSAMINTSQKGKVLTHSITLVSPKLMIVGEECLASYENIREKIDLPDNMHLYFADLNTLSDKGSCRVIGLIWQANHTINRGITLNKLSKSFQKTLAFIFIPQALPASLKRLYSITAVS